MLQANRVETISHETLSEVGARNDQQPGYQDRKVALKCTYPGCEDPPEDDCNECRGHRLDSRKRRRRYRLKRRAEWVRQKLCLRCGGRRRKGSKWCAPCLIKAGKLSQAERDNQRDKSDSGWRATIEQSPDGVLRERHRYHGSGKRGAPSKSQLDDHDLAEARKRLAEGTERLALVASPEVQALPRVQRDEVKRYALDKLRQARDWIDDVLDRNDKSRGSRGSGES